MIFSYNASVSLPCSKIARTISIRRSSRLQPLTQPCSHPRICTSSRFPCASLRYRAINGTVQSSLSSPTTADTCAALIASPSATRFMMATSSTANPSINSCVISIIPSQYIIQNRQRGKSWQRCCHSKFCRPHAPAITKPPRTKRGARCAHAVLCRLTLSPLRGSAPRNAPATTAVP